MFKRKRKIIGFNWKRGLPLLLGLFLFESLIFIFIIGLNLVIKKEIDIDVSDILTIGDFNFTYYDICIFMSFHIAMSLIEFGIYSIWNLLFSESLKCIIYEDIK